MTDSPQRGQWGNREEPTQAFGNGYPGYPDPAYASQTPYGQAYQPPTAPPPTERLSGYQPPYGYEPYTGGHHPPQYPPEPPPPEGPKTPRWLWVIAAIAVVTVIGLVIALVIVNSSRQQTVMAPLPSQPEPSFSTSPSAPTTTSPRSPTTTPSTSTQPVPPLPTITTSPTPSTGTTTPGGTDTVVYNVTGSGRAINITYVDTGGLLQTEFNVMLPWSKEVTLPRPGEDSASISIINVGREVTCSIAVNGIQVEQREGAGLTICTATR
ncbi:hypothetical protein JDV09_22575 [Mycobacterium sp. Y57]|uniref:MmpS family transport accessory protein n=1 Tax=Mycolicibacterium xanthum TaxID=2796469 RepID=UPI001C842DF7|nr:MmpS family transport accessory protein [Mycolicibacterium xanthum]MBX7434859.1 hypothetical protein [Mycolicibacterium xanthum]